MLDMSMTQGQNEVNAWFVKNVQKVLQQNGMKIT